MSDSYYSNDDRKAENAEVSFNELVEQLIAGKTISVVATVTSMQPRIESGQMVKIAPVDPSNVKIDDIVLVRWKKGRFIAHLVKEIEGNRFLIGNNWGKINGWVYSADILGIVTDITNP